jgi:hypothetical protein
LFSRSEFHTVCVFPAEAAALADNLLKIDSEPVSKKEGNYLEIRKSGNK